MKNAKKMFEKLGYGRHENYDESGLYEIVYFKYNDYAPQIHFNLDHKCVMVCRKEYKASWFDKKILQAINKQVEELWGEEK